jgi:hypothetical protein
MGRLIHTQSCVAVQIIDVGESHRNEHRARDPMQLPDVLFPSISQYIESIIHHLWMHFPLKPLIMLDTFWVNYNDRTLFSRSLESCVLLSGIILVYPG